MVSMMSTASTFPKKVLANLTESGMLTVYNWTELFMRQ